MRPSLLVSKPVKLIIDFLVISREATFCDNILSINDNPNKYIYLLCTVYSQRKKRLIKMILTYFFNKNILLRTQAKIPMKS